MFPNGFDERVGGPRQAIKWGLLHGTALAANPQLFGKAKTLHPGGQQADCVEQGCERLLPRFRSFHRSEQNRHVVQNILREAENAFDFLLCGEEPDDEPGELAFFPWGWKNDAEEPVEGLGDKAPVVRQACFGEERESIGFVEDGGDTGMETVAHLGGGIQNSQPIAFPPPFVPFPGLRAGFGLQFGDAVVAMAEPFKELDEGVKPSSTCARTRKGFGPIREPAKRRMALVLRWEQRKNQVSGRFHSSHQNEK